MYPFPKPSRGNSRPRCTPEVGRKQIGALVMRVILARVRFRDGLALGAKASEAVELEEPIVASWLIRSVQPA